MNFKFFIFFILLISSFFFYFHNKQSILQIKREGKVLVEKYNAERAVYNQLLETNQILSSRERITKLAYEKLDMIFPLQDIGNSNVYTIKEKTERSSVFFKLLDYLSPTAEALSNSRNF